MDERTGRRVFFNSVIAAFTGWNDSRHEKTVTEACHQKEPASGKGERGGGEEEGGEEEEEEQSQ